MLNCDRYWHHDEHVHQQIKEEFDFEYFIWSLVLFWYWSSGGGVIGIAEAGSDVLVNRILVEVAAEVASPEVCFGNVVLEKIIFERSPSPPHVLMPIALLRIKGESQGWQHGAYESHCSYKASIQSMRTARAHAGPQ